MRGTRVGGLAALVVVMCTAPSARAQGIVGKKLVILDRTVGSPPTTRQKLVFVARQQPAIGHDAGAQTTCGTFPCGGVVATVEVIDVATPTNRAVYEIQGGATPPLGREGWRSDEATVARFSNRDAPSGGGTTGMQAFVSKPGKPDPVTQQTPGVVAKAVARSTGDTDQISLPISGDGSVDVRFTIGTHTLCARFDTTGSLVQKVLGPTGAPSGHKYVAKDPLTMGSCAPAPVTCGNGTVDGTEECDDGGTSSGDGCSATCELEDASALCAGVPSVSGTGLDSVRVASGLTRPVHVTAAPLDPNRFFIVEQDGRILIVKNGLLLSTPFLAIQGIVACCGERGLLSLAFHPAYPSDPRFFVNYTREGDGATVIARYTVSGNPDVANPAGTVIRVIPQDFANHNGGQVAFGPDGALYVGMGDGGAGGDPNERAQDDTQLLGKMLRIEVDAAAPLDPLDEIWAKGLRNPWRFSFDRATGDLYIADVGQNAFEEVNYQAAPLVSGVNYGWDVFEANACFEPTPPAAMCPSPPTGFTFPVLDYDHGDGCSVTGGFAYRGCAMPDLHGTYFYSDICTPFVKTFQGVSGGVAQNLQDRTADVAPGGGLSIGGVSSFGEDSRGEIYIVDYGNGNAGQGEVYRIIPES